MTIAVPPPTLGFLTVVTEGTSYIGGYLVTNAWGRPLEFRLSSTVQPNRVQQILYGPTLGIYLGADLIGKTLFEKTSTPAKVVVTDSRDTLELRRSLNVPVVWAAPANTAEGLIVREAGPVLAHPDYPDDMPMLKDVFARLGALDLAEPFVRIREAIAEARKMGVTQRAAG